MVPWHTLSFSLRHNQGSSGGECSCSSRRNEVKDSFSCGNLFFVEAEGWRITKARPNLGATIQSSMWAVSPHPWTLAQVDECHCFPVPHRGTQLSLGSYKKLPFLRRSVNFGVKMPVWSVTNLLIILVWERQVSLGKAGASLGMESVKPPPSKVLSFWN